MRCSITTRPPIPSHRAPRPAHRRRGTTPSADTRATRERRRRTTCSPSTGSARPPRFWSVMSGTTPSNVTAKTQFLQAGNETYAYRRFGGGHARPLLFLQHFTGTLDNWDPAVTDPLATERQVILFDSAGVGRSTGEVPTTVAGMASHALDFLDSLGLDRCDVLGFSLGGMVAQQMALDRPSVFRRMILVGTAPRGGEDIMHLEKPSLARHFGDPTLKGYAVLQKIFFAQTSTSQMAGGAFIERLAQRKVDLDAASGPDVVAAQIAAFRQWEQPTAT